MDERKKAGKNEGEAKRRRKEGRKERREEKKERERKQGSSVCRTNLFITAGANKIKERRRTWNEWTVP